MKLRLASSRPLTWRAKDPVSGHDAQAARFGVDFAEFRRDMGRLGGGASAVVGNANVVEADAFNGVAQGAP